MLRRYGNFPGFTESWGRLRSTPTTSKRCVSRLYLISGIATGFHGTDTVSGSVETANGLLLLTLGLFGSGEDRMCSGRNTLVICNGLNKKIVRLAFRCMPFLATDFKQRKMFGVVNDGVELFATDLDLRGVRR